MRAGQQKRMGKNTGGGVVFKEVQHKKREANRKGDVQEQNAFQIRVRKNSKFGEGQSST